MDFGFEDDLFEPVKQRTSFEDTVNEMIKSYVAKEAIPNNFLNEASVELEDSVNLIKTQGDYYFFNKNYKIALDKYQTSLSLSMKSSAINNTIFQREINESISRCCIKLDMNNEALEIIKNLEETAQNFETYTTALNLHMDYLDAINFITREASSKLSSLKTHSLVICKLISMHPLFSTLWIKLAENFISQIDILKELEESKKTLISHLTTCFLVIKEINKHGYAHRSELVVKQKDMQKKWLYDIETMLQALKIDMKEILSRNENIENWIIERLDKADKAEDGDKLKSSRGLNDLNSFFMFLA